MRITKQHCLALLVSLLIAHFLLASAYSALNPLGEAPDEVDHWAYVVHLARAPSLPTSPRMTQGKHPPFYHATAALIASLGQPSFKFLRANPDVEFQRGATGSPNFFIHTTLENWPWQGGALAFHLARFWSVLLSTGTLAATYGLMRTAFPQRRTLALTTVGFLAFLPEFLFISGAVNNDNAAALFGTVALWGGFAIYRGSGQFKAGWWTPLALGLGLLAKVSTLALWGVVGCAILLGVLTAEISKQPVQDKKWRFMLSAYTQAAVRTWQQWLKTGLLIFAPALLIAAPWLVRNWRLYGDPLGMALVRQTIDLRPGPWTWADTVWLLHGWFVSFWGKFGGAGQIPMAGWIYDLLASLAVISGFGLLRAWRNQRDLRAFLAFLVLAMISVSVAMWRYSLIALGTDQGRLLYPALAPLTALFVIGLLAWLPVDQLRKAGVTLVLGSFILGLYGLFAVIQPNFAPAPHLLADDINLSPTKSINFNELSVVDWDLQENLTLYWYAQQQPSQDWRSVLRVVTEDGRVAWEWRRSPGGGRWSTDHWPTGTIVRDAYAIHWPDWAGAGRYRVEIGLQSFGEAWVVPKNQNINATTVEHPFRMLGWITHLPKPK